MKPSQAGRSAGKIIGGLALLLVGAFFWLDARLSAVAAEETGLSAWGVAGIVVAAVGFVVVLYGVWQLATNVDLAADVAARALYTQRQQDAVADAEARRRAQPPAAGAP
ncbi:hypothetical protein [Cellulomonas composti]|uniref:Uncharacterized protein n=1 Tax=Cellulomonas composti TaxID=266130 RepID=A0A511J9A6_9CELL|nr:hypothetical protein [Cellulomonas composti]GEL94568.1 hypothetical protein CCO02nite_12260 [Cellulomonas composti]